MPPKDTDHFLSSFCRYEGQQHEVVLADAAWEKPGMWTILVVPVHTDHVNKAL